ncbi:MAG: hypothetical protein DRP18_01385, partial [Candidatus Aenigmatarchaeota archaeon]
KVCRDFKIINPLTNQTQVKLTRSVWQIENGLGICEDGSVWNIRKKEKTQIKEYSDSFLYQYYTQIGRKETGIGELLFRNLRAKSYGNKTLVYSEDMVALFQDGKMKWKKRIDNLDLDMDSNSIYILESVEYEHEVIGIYDWNGERKDEILVPASPCKSGYRIKSSEGKILIANGCEIKLIKGNDVQWYIDRSGFLEGIKVNDTYILFTDIRDSPAQKIKAYSVYGTRPRKFWYYQLPYAMRKHGYIASIKPFGRNLLALLYKSEEDRDRIIVLDMDGNEVKTLRITDRIYPGVLDKYLLNQTLMNIIQEADFSVLNEIPEEIREGRWEEAREKFGEKEIQRFQSVLNSLPLAAELLWKFHSLDMNRLEDLKYRESIRFIDTCDYNGDGYEDLIVSGDGFFVVRNGKDLSEILLIDRNSGRYDNEFNRFLKENFTREWYDEDYNVFCTNDVNGDGKKDLFLFAFNGFKLMESHEKDYKVRWERYFKNIGWDSITKVNDIDGDGIEDIILPIHPPNQPTVMKFISTKNYQELENIEMDRFNLEIIDLDGDEKNEVVLSFDSPGYGAKIKIFSQTLDWEYDRLRDFWKPWTVGSHLLPFAVLPDRTGDGVRELAVGVLSRNDEGSRVLIYDVKNNQLVQELEIEKSEFGFDESWVLSPEVRFLNNALFVSAPKIENRRESKLYIYDLDNQRIDKILWLTLRRIYPGNKTLILERDGSVVWLEKEMKPEARIQEEHPLRIKTPEGYFVKVYVDDSLVAGTRNETLEMRLVSGSHTLRVHLLSPEGIEWVSHYKITSFNLSDTSILNIIIIILLAIYLGLKIWKRPLKLRV